ncbi:MAG: Hpt domain-containing protein [Thiotrichales bacterium]|nr:Hpt domain-containing protein [Thiotrichales bacterium]
MSNATSNATSDAMSNLSSIDTNNLALLHEILGDDLQEILHAFLATMPELIGQIELSIQIQDADGVQLHAHTLKGSSANIGASKLPILCAALEESAKQGVINENIVALLPPLKVESEQLKTELSQFLQSF